MKIVKNTWNRGILGKMVVGLGALVVGCCGLTTLGAIVTPRSASPVATTVPTVQAATATTLPPTATIEPTEAATPTTEPTAVPEPTPTASISKDKQLYALQLVPIARELADAFKAISKLSGDASKDPSLILSSDWNVDMGVQLFILQNNATKLREIETPPGLEEVGDKTSALASELDLVVLNFTQGVDKRDAEKIVAASKAMGRSNELMSDIAKLLTQ